MKDLTKISILDENGNSKDCDILDIFNDEKSGKSYITYTDNTKDENGNVNIYSSRYTLKNGEYVLQNDLTEEEYDLLEAHLNEDL